MTKSQNNNKVNKNDSAWEKLFDKYNMGASQISDK